jgi:hypothetical protein
MGLVSCGESVAPYHFNGSVLMCCQRLLGRHLCIVGYIVCLQKLPTLGYTSSCLRSEVILELVLISSLSIDGSIKNHRYKQFCSKVSKIPLFSSHSLMKYVTSLTSASVVSWDCPLLPLGTNWLNR